MMSGLCAFATAHFAVSGCLRTGLFYESYGGKSTATAGCVYNKLNKNAPCVPPEHLNWHLTRCRLARGSKLRDNTRDWGRDPREDLKHLSLCRALLALNHEHVRVSVCSCAHRRAKTWQWGDPLRSIIVTCQAVTYGRSGDTRHPSRLQRQLRAKRVRACTRWTPASKKPHLGVYCCRRILIKLKNQLNHFSGTSFFFANLTKSFYPVNARIKEQFFSARYWQLVRSWWGFFFF